MTKEDFKLTWSNYSYHLRDMLQEMMKSDSLTDVTLVCDDDVQIKVHRVVLSACSDVFRKIIYSLPKSNTDSVIYLRGIKHQEMQSILEFMYLGEVTCNQSKVDEIMNVAKNLKIKGINKNMEFDKNSVISEFVEMEKSYNSEHFNSERDSPNHQDQIDPGQDQLLKQNLDNHKEVSSHVAMSGKIQKCGIEYSKLKYLKEHSAIKGKGSLNPKTGKYKKYVPVQCEQCDKIFSQKGNLYTHMNSEHKGVFYPCEKCDYQATCKGNLKQHIKNKWCN